ncbi:MAG TPA: MraY family glycosyltransferase [Rubricoccaceae bacterium]
MTHVLFAALLAFLGALAVTRLARGAGLHFGHLDRPDERKRHAQAVPRLGGIGIAAGVFAGLALAVALGSIPVADVWPLAMGSTAIIAMGIWDDLYGIGFKRRFAVQLLVAYNMAMAGWRIDVTNLPLFEALPPFEQAALSLPVTILWTVGVINAVNLLDGLDGLVAGITTIAFGALALAFAGAGDPLVLTLCAVGAAAVLGFLVFNVHPASIFMGDTGSTLLGFLLAMVGLRGITGVPTLGMLAVPVLVLGVPLLDTLTTMTRRLVEGNSPFMPDADHIHHRVLARSHGSVRRAVRAMWAVGMVFGALGVAMSMTRGHDLAQVAIIGLAIVLSYIVVRSLRYARIRVVWRNLQRRRLHSRRADRVGVSTPTGSVPALPPGPALAARRTSGDGEPQSHPPSMVVSRR